MKKTSTKIEAKTVVVVGGGFAGLNVAKTLSNHSEVYVYLIDQRNHHLFQPLLYQVATAGLNVSDIAVPIRSQFSNVKNVEVHLGKVDKIDFQSKTLYSHHASESLQYDYLVLACGAQHSYFAHPEWEEYAPGLKTLEQATEIRRRILSAFEQAENELDPKKQLALLNFVVVGGGPTGVELAGAIADISRTVLVNDFKRIDPYQAKVILLEAGPRLLAAFNSGLSEYTKKALTSLGVQVRTSSRVEKVDKEGVQVGTEFIPTKSVFWAAGVQACQMQMQPELQKDRAGRVLVSADLSVPEFPDVFVIGDMAAVKQGDGWVPGLAPAAIQEGRHAAKNILQSIRKKSRQPFQYLDKGQMATIGKNKAVLEFGKLKLTGRIAWLGWLFVHIFFLIGFKNKFAVLLQWFWSYLFSKRGARLITEKDWKLKPN